jgi:hypothetical protein
LLLLLLLLCELYIKMKKIKAHNRQNEQVNVERCVENEPRKERRSFVKKKKKKKKKKLILFPFFLLANSSLLVNALQRATRPGAAFDADLCRSMLTACAQPQQPLSISPPHQSTSTNTTDSSPSTPPDENPSATVESSPSSVSSSAAAAVVPATPTPSSLAEASVAVDEFTNRLRLAVAGALASVSPTAAAAAPADDLDRGQFVERAANLVAKVERTEPDAALWLPFLAALVSVGGVLAIAASVRRVLAPTTLAAVLALSASPTSNASGLSPTPTPPPLSPRSMSTGASLPMSPTGATSPPVSVDESRLQRYARVERADRVRQSYVAVLKAVLKDWRLLPRSPLASLLLLCDAPNGALVRDVLLQLARDDSAAFWQALVAGIDPLLVERRRLPESARSSSSAGDATPVRRYSIDADSEALVRTTSPVIRTTSPLARIERRRARWRDNRVRHAADARRRRGVIARRSTVASVAVTRCWRRSSWRCWRGGARSTTTTRRRARGSATR